MRNIYLIISLIIYQISLAGGETLPIGGAQRGMANTMYFNGNIWSLYSNQAGLANLEGTNVGIDYINQFTTSALAQQTLGISHSLNNKTNTTFGISYSHFGFNLYQENNIGVAYAMKFSDKISGGIKLNYQSFNIGNEYGNYGTITAEAGIIAQLNDHLFAGFHLYNPTRNKISDRFQERLPSFAKLAIGYQFSDKTSTIVEVEKDVNYNPILKIAGEYSPNKVLDFRLGISTNPNIITFGVGIHHKQLRFDFSSSYHTVLGISPGLSISYQFSKK